MKNHNDSPFLLKSATLLIGLISLIYSNTLNYPWHLDDYQNINKNSAVHLTSINKKSIKNTFYAASSKSEFSRPLAYFSFALNWYCGKDEPTGYRVVNISIHILTAFFLYLTVFYLFQTPNLKGLDSNSIYFVALLSAVFWAVNPIQIQAVTYIVQRMTSMAALFYTIAMLCYLKTRLTQLRIERTLYILLCGLSFLLGIASKSNAILLPVSLLLLEFSFFKDLTQKQTQKQAAAILFGGTILVATAGIFLFLDGNPGKILGGYNSRPFTLYERLLTEPGIVLFYLSQILYPIPSRLSIAHDITISTSLFTPWYTLAAILLILVLIVFSVLHIKKNPLFSFSLLFFFGNHVIESTIIPLELIFEHRNYLPSLFLFVPVSVGIKKALDYYRPTQKPMFAFLVLSVCGIIISLGISTYLRNWDWRSVRVLWQDAMEKAPLSAAPVQNLAWGYYGQTGQVEKAIALYQRGLQLKDNSKNYDFFAYNNLADIYYSKLMDYTKALEYAEQALKIHPGIISTNIIFCKALSMLGRYDEALAHLDMQLDQDPNAQAYLYFKGFLLLRQEKLENAQTILSRCLALSPESWLYLRDIGICITHMGYHKRGYWFLKRTQEANPNNQEILLGLADNRIRAEQLDEAEKWIKQLIRLIGTDNLYRELKASAEYPLGIPVSYDKISFIASTLFKKMATEYTEKANQLEEDFDRVK